MASQIVLQEPQQHSVQAPEQEKQPTLVEGYFQSCEGHMKRRSKILKRWKKEYIKVIPGSYCRYVCVESPDLEWGIGKPASIGPLSHL